MSALDKFHDEAMEAAFFADQERRRGNRERAAELFEQALDLELKALEEITESVEPTYSILHRSAGWLALDCNQPRLAEQLASKALAGDPHPKIAEELRDLMEQINFRRHLLLKGITLEEGEIQLSLSGQSVGLGIVSQDDFLERVDNSSKMLRRIVERRSNRPFQEKGPPIKDIKENYELFLSTPRAASFAVTLKLGRPADQQISIPGILNTDAILDEFMDLMEMISQSRVAEIQESISDPAYLRNFIGLSKKIAPDGERIRQVGFTVLRGGTERFVEVTTPASEFPPIPVIEEPQSVETELVEVRGILRYADAMQASNKIKVIDENKQTYVIEVPEGIMNDIVRPMWDSQVRIKGIRTGKRIILEDIWPDED